MTQTGPTTPTETADFRRWKRDITLFLSGQTISLFGSMVVQYAVMWYLTLTTKDGTIMALSAVFGFGPQAIVSIFGGVWADRHNRKMLIMLADGAIALSTLALALFMLSGTTNVWMIFAFLAIRSVGAGVQTPAVAALVPQLVPQDKLLRVNGINQSILSGMMLIAPAAAAGLYSVLPMGAVFFVDVITAVIGIGFLAVIPVATVVRDDIPSYFGDLIEGARYANGHPVVRWMLGLFAVVMVLFAAPSYLSPLMVVRSFGDEVWKLTVLELSFSIGMLLSGFAVGIWGHHFKRVTLIMVSILTCGALSIGLGLSPNLWIFLVFMFLTGIAVPAFATPSTTLLQETVEPERQGRVFGLLGIVQAVAMPVGMAIFGPMANVISVELVLIIAGVLVFVIAAIAMAVPSGRRAFRDAGAA